MADFLSHLAQRLDDSAVGVRPRLPAMFEAAPDEAMPADGVGLVEQVANSFDEAPGEPFEPDGADGGPRLRERRDVRASPKRRVHQEVPPDAPLPEDATAAEGVHHAAIHDVVKERTHFIDAASLHVSERQARMSDVEPMQVAPQRASHVVAAHESSAVRPEPEQPVRRPMSESRRDTAGNVPPSPPRGAGPRSAVAAVVRATATTPESHDAPALNPAASLRPRAEPPPRHAVASRIATSSPMPAPEPVIHVTIGRIEVRANTASAPVAQKPRDASPVMALDDYLRGRTEGGRR